MTCFNGFDLKALFYLKYGLTRKNGYRLSSLCCQLVTHGLYFRWLAQNQPWY